MKRRYTDRLLGVLSDLLLLTLSSFLFALSFPGFISKWGWGPLAFVSLVPAFFVASRASWKTIAPYGAFFGFLSYSLFNFWLAKFHPLAIIIVPTIYFTYLLFTFIFLRLAAWLFPRYGYLVQILVWISYEYLRTQGFLGYSYGIMGYSQYRFLPLVQLASLTGVWGVSLLTVFPSAYLAAAFKKGGAGVKSFFRRHRVDALVYMGVFLGAVFYGFFSPVDYGSAKEWKVALIQHNVDPWRGGVRAYRENLDRLLRLSTQALAENPEIVIWSETAFVPGIDWHTRYREDPEIYSLVDELKTYLKKQKVPFVVGNDDGRLGKDSRGRSARLDYNAAILFEKGEIQEIYRKVHLVPFTENFPYEKQLPGVYAWLKSADTHFWERGTEFSVFTAGGVTFATPICFEDSFGYISRIFVQRGAEVIVNMTNDSWSGSVAAAMQHMSKAVFRAVENRRSVIRCSNGGMTCTIDPNGRITNMLEPYTEGYLIGMVPIYTEKRTLYTLWGDWFAFLCLVGGVGFILVGFLRRFMIKRIKIDNTSQV